MRPDPQVIHPTRGREPHKAVIVLFHTAVLLVAAGMMALAIYGFAYAPKGLQ